MHHHLGEEGKHPKRANRDLIRRGLPDAAREEGARRDKADEEEGEALIVLGRTIWAAMSATTAPKPTATVAGRSQPPNPRSAHATPIAHIASPTHVDVESSPGRSKTAMTMTSALASAAT